MQGVGFITPRGYFFRTNLNVFKKPFETGQRPVS